MHAANPDQIFLVTPDSGWVRTGNGAPARPIAQGEQIDWRAGVYHESGSEHGMSALVTEGRSLP